MQCKSYSKVKHFSKMTSTHIFKLFPRKETRPLIGWISYSQPIRDREIAFQIFCWCWFWKSLTLGRISCVTSRSRFDGRQTWTKPTQLSPLDMCSRWYEHTQIYITNIVLSIQKKYRTYVLHLHFPCWFWSQGTIIGFISTLKMYLHSLQKMSVFWLLWLRDFLPAKKELEIFGC